VALFKPMGLFSHALSARAAGEAADPLIEVVSCLPHLQRRGPLSAGDLSASSRRATESAEGRCRLDCRGEDHRRVRWAGRSAEAGQDWKSLVNLTEVSRQFPLSVSTRLRGVGATANEQRACLIFSLKPVASNARILFELELCRSSPIAQAGGSRSAWTDLERQLQNP
jgi:hypothetical protein